ncbi:MAG: hypothetical protein FWF02_02160 [Micrococcales bacterium]|nr:hypothetical protein [Micrococcales bacterium]
MAHEGAPGVGLAGVTGVAGLAVGWLAAAALVALTGVLGGGTAGLVRGVASLGSANQAGVDWRAAAGGAAGAIVARCGGL